MLQYIYIYNSKWVEMVGASHFSQSFNYSLDESCIIQIDNVYGVWHYLIHNTPFLAFFFLFLILIPACCFYAVAASNCILYFNFDLVYVWIWLTTKRMTKIHQFYAPDLFFFLERRCVQYKPYSYMIICKPKMRGK